MFLVHDFIHKEIFFINSEQRHLNSTFPEGVSKQRSELSAEIADIQRIHHLPEDIIERFLLAEGKLAMSNFEQRAANIIENNFAPNEK